ncbi:MAG: glycosyltransferase [Planctomycetota bacterium]
MGPLWIVIPTKDRPRELAEQLSRLLAQARALRGRRVVIVVSDDGSVPPARKPPSRHVELIRTATSRGPNLARHDAIVQSPADAFIIEIDDHDLVEAGALFEIDRAFRAGAFLVYGDCLRVNSLGRPAAVGPVYAKGAYRQWGFRDEGALHIGMRAYRRSLYDDVGGYRNAEFPGGDYALVLRMEARLGGRGIVAIPKVLCRMVTSARGISVRLAAEQARAAEVYRARVAAEYTKDAGDAAPWQEPDPPDFSDVEMSFAWRGCEGRAELLKERSAERVGNGRDGRAPPAVSAVVPLFKSERYVERCLRSLLAHLPADSEVIAVDDGSPDRSGELARRVLSRDPRGLVVTLSRNTGFAHATNVGAALARGEHLLLMNADAFAREGFIAPMLREMERDAQVAIVGNRHVTPAGRVDSEGSEFSWSARTFQHVGRDIADPVVASRASNKDAHDGQDGLTAASTTSNRGGKDKLTKGRSASRPSCPSLLNVVPGVPRDMVTFACALVRGTAWRELGGLDERYAKAYFEDSDLCMRARSRGWRVAYVPDSEVVHVGRHSRAGGGAHYAANRELFERRWVRTGLVDRFARERGLRVHADRKGSGRVVVCMIACSEEEFVAAAIESVYALADSIVVVEGGTRFAVGAGLCDAKGRSTDDTVFEIESVCDPERKIELVRAPGRPWRDKSEMRNGYAKRLRAGDWMLLLDADEVFTEAGLWRMSALMHDHDVIMPAFRLFWNGMSTLGTGRWDDYRQIKAVRWREGFTYARDHNTPTDSRGVAVTAIPGARVARPPADPDGRLYFHYSWAGKTDAKLAMKCAYYVGQNGARVFPPDYMTRVFVPWRERPDEIEREFGTHPYGGGGSAVFEGEHPTPVRKWLFTTETRGAPRTTGT